MPSIIGPNLVPIARHFHSRLMGGAERIVRHAADQFDMLQPQIARAVGDGKRYPEMLHAKLLPGLGKVNQREPRRVLGADDQSLVGAIRTHLDGECRLQIGIAAC